MDTSALKCRAFVEAARLGSITRAAEAMSYTQSAVSRMVSDLERDWGLALLERRHEGTALTSEGALLLDAAAAVVRAHDDLESRIDEARGLETGFIRIGTFSSVATHWLPRVISGFLEDHPGIGYELMLGDYAEIAEWVREGRADCGFLREPAGPGLSSRTLARDEIMAVLPAGHELASLDAVPLELLCEHPFILLGRDGNDEIAELLAARGLSPDVRFTTWDDYSIAAMVEGGMGVALLHSLILTRMPYDVAVRPLDQPAYRNICVAAREGRTPSLATRRFLEHVDLKLGSGEPPANDGAIG